MTAANLNPTAVSEVRFGSFHTHARTNWLSNLAVGIIIVDGQRYRTAEHYYQTEKLRLAADFIQADDPTTAATLRAQAAALVRDNRPSRVRSEAQRIMAGPMVSQRFRDEWNDTHRMDTMRTGLRAKFSRDSAVCANRRQRLLDTGNARIVEEARWDAFWGSGPRGDGLNHLGRELERLRAELRAEDEQQSGLAPAVADAA